MPTSAPAPDAPNLLVVDDQEANLLLLERLLRRAGHERLRLTTDPRAVGRLVAECVPDLLLLDLHMPGVDGFAVMEELRSTTREGGGFPILVLTADASPEVRRRALASGASDFLHKPLDALEVVLRIRNLLETHRLHAELRERNRTLEARVRERTRALEESQGEVLERLAQAAEAHDDDTGLHTRRVGELAAGLARVLGLPEEEVELIRRTAPLHDVGKIGVPDAVLRKPGPLTEAEREVMRRHTVIGARILAGGRSEPIRLAERIALGHHERWDGTGYPRGARSEAIPLAARIVAVADVYDALAHERPYRPALPPAAVAETIERGRGTHFDPRVVDAFHRLGAPLPPPAPPGGQRIGCSALERWGD